MTIKQADISISVLIPTCNGAKTLAELFATLGRQTIKAKEILVVDSSSDDRTVEICRENGAKVWSISREEFDHGATRTFLTQKATGDIVVFFTQDAILASRDALSLLVEAVLPDDSPVCCYGRQLPSLDANWHAAGLRRFNYPEVSTVKSFADRGSLGLKTIFTSNSFAAYKREELLEAGGFKNGMIFGEDTYTVGRLLKAGYTIAYVAEAAVYHSHNYSLAEEFKRSFDIGVLHTSEQWLLDTFGKAEGQGIKYVKSAIIELAGEHRYLLMIDFVVRTGVKYLAYKIGRNYRHIPASCCQLLSMNSYWWRKE